jgi:iron complex outermembrane recepter protein
MKHVFLALMAVLLLGRASAQVTLSGTVSDDAGKPLVGASVRLVEAGKGTATDEQGKFEILDIANGTYTLEVRHLGFGTYRRSIVLVGDELVSVKLEPDVFRGEEIIVYATRANENTPTTFTDFSKKEIAERNLGQDLPILLNFTPSIVTTSDAGAGVGYTGLRIRGSDPTRVNVTINGIPVNDSESHGVFWVNMPDFSSSVQSIQIQRGVGSSTNGAGAFGATVNMQTNMPSREGFAEVSNSVGSFNTRKHSVTYNTGLLNDKWAFEGRLSQINSDGYIDRAFSDLKSWYLSGGYYGKKTTVKALMFGGKEITYQAWNGVPEARLKNDVDGMNEIISNNGYTAEQAENLLNSGRTFNLYLYDNQVDNYAQDHYQLHVGHEFSEKIQANLALHYTYGRGYYEQFRYNDRLSRYGLPNVEIGDETITRSDIIRRKWLDNDFYGFTYSLNFFHGPLAMTLGGGYHYYVGGHFGELVWMRYAGNTNSGDIYYDNTGRKEDFNVFAKANYQLTERLNLYGDLQLRFVDYALNGIDDDLQNVEVERPFQFFNPKFGAVYQVDANSDVYGSYAIGNREPVRSDIIDNPGIFPEHETLYNTEIGYRRYTDKYLVQVNGYVMKYRNQLVLTGALNDVGASIRENVPDSYRRGIELSTQVNLGTKWEWNANLTLSQNKIEEYTEILYNYGENWDEYNVEETVFKNSDIAFSPNVIAGGQLTYKPVSGLRISVFTKYVGRQYLDNTSNNARSIDPYYLKDMLISYEFSTKAVQRVQLSLLVNNMFNNFYISNGYTFGYAAGEYVVRENWYYPQAGRNYLAALTLKF